MDTRHDGSASNRTSPPAVPGRRTADRRARRPRACRCASWSWRAPSRSCRRHAGARRRARAGEARRGWEQGRRRIRRPNRQASRQSISTPSRANAALWRFSGRWSPNLPTRIMASRLGPAKPRGIGCDGAGGSVTPSQSRQANFSRTRSMTFQRRGSHSSVLDTTSPSLRSRAPPHLPQTHGAGSTMRSTGRSPAACEVRVADAGVAPWRSRAPRSRPWSLPRPASPPDPRSPVRAARREACSVPTTGRRSRGAPWPVAASAARSRGRELSLRSVRRRASRAGRGSSHARSSDRPEGRPADRRQDVRAGSSRRRREQIRQQKSPAKRPPESIGRSHPAAVGRQVFCGIRQSMPDKR